MKTRRALKEMSRLADRHCVRKGRKWSLEDVDPSDTGGVASKSHGEKLLEKSIDLVRERQEKLYAQEHAPLDSVPADHKWCAHLVVASAIIGALEELDLEFPEVEKAKRKELQKVRDALLAEKD